MCLSEDKNSTARKDVDQTLINELCTLIKVQEPDIKIIFRLGNPSTKTRPLKLVFNNKKTRKYILNNASNIKNIPSINILSKVIIAKDLSPATRTKQEKKGSEK
jgi:hypothetical protein